MTLVRGEGEIANNRARLLRPSCATPAGQSTPSKGRTRIARRSARACRRSVVMRAGSVDEESTGRRPQPRAALPVLRSPPTRRARVRGRERSCRSRRPRSVAKRARSSPHLQRPGHVVSRLDRRSARIVARPHALGRLTVARRAVRQLDLAENQVSVPRRVEPMSEALHPIGAAPRPRRNEAQFGQRFEVNGARLAGRDPERQTWRRTTPPRSVRRVDIRRRSRGAPMRSTTS